MKYHKIRNVPIDVCTAEQKIAYNLAFANTYELSIEYHAAQSGIIRAEIVRDAVNCCMTCWSYGPCNNGRYNTDAIFCALNAGIEKYLQKREIFTDYKQVGEAFPAYYLNK